MKKPGSGGRRNEAAARAGKLVGRPAQDGKRAVRITAERYVRLQVLALCQLTTAEHLVEQWIDDATREVAEEPPDGGRGDKRGR